MRDGGGSCGGGPGSQLVFSRGNRDAKEEVGHSAAVAMAFARSAGHLLPKHRERCSSSHCCIARS